MRDVALFGTSLRVLVVDDDPAVIYAARALLARKGCRVEAAFKGLDAVARARAGAIDAVLLDVEMPEVDGLSVARELRNLKSPPRVVLMADNPTDAARASIANGDALGILRKPIEFAHALTLFTGELPDAPISIRLDPTRAAYPTARDVLEGKSLALAHEAPLPAGTPLTILIPHGRKSIAVAATAVKNAKHLEVRPSLLTPTTRGELTDFLRRGAAIAGARPPSKKVARPQDAKGDRRAKEMFLRGMRRLEQGKYVQALTDLTGARELSTRPEYASAFAHAQQLASSHRARNLVRKARTLVISEPREALANLEEAIRLEPTRASTHLEAARLQMQLGEDLVRAEERLGAAVHLAPSDPVPRLQLAQLLERQNQNQEALWATDAALALFPGDRELQTLATRLRKKLALAASRKAV